jgi:hypothetical protein
LNARFSSQASFTTFSPTGAPAEYRRRLRWFTDFVGPIMILQTVRFPLCPTGLILRVRLIRSPAK